MAGATTQTQTAAFLAALSTKSTRSETIDEISGCAQAVSDHAFPVEHAYEVLDIVVTGGDNAHSFNISTTSAFVIAVGGVRVAKHGNRAASSACGMADCFEALGARIDLGPAESAQMLEQVGLCFLFAQRYHTSMHYVGAIRKELGIRTVFNILGPLTNPARPSFMMLGVYDEHLVEPVAKVLSDLGVRHAFVIYGTDRFDEISASAPTQVCELRDGFYCTVLITPEQFGLKRCVKDDLLGGTPQQNAEITRAVLAGESGPHRTVVLLNAGAALYLGGVADSCGAGAALASRLLDSGAAAAKLEEFVAATNAFARE